VDYPTMTVPAAGDAIPIWDAGTDATQQIFWSTFVSSFQGLDADLTSWAAITPGTGIATALAVNVGSAGAPVLFNGAGGTPSSLTGTNITGTATGLTAGISNGLKSATTTVSVSAATAPSSGQVLTATSSTAATWQSVTGTGDVTAASAFGTDNVLIRSDGTGKGTQATGITVSDGDAISGVASIATTGAVTAGSLEFEGATADAFETTIAVTDPTADNTLTLPNASGTVALAQIVTKSTAANYTIGTTDSRELYGGTIYVTGAATITIPAVAAGASFTVITIGAVAVSVDPNAADLIYLDGTALADGDKVTNTSTAGDVAVFTYLDGTGWYASTNAWTDGN